MKNFRVFKQFVCGSLAGVSVMFMVSCGSSKQAQNDAMMMQMMQMMQNQQQSQQNLKDDNSYGVEIKKTETELYAEQAPGKRSAANGQAFTKEAAEQFARNNARAKYAEAIESAVISAAKTVYGEMSEFAADEKSGESATEGGQKQHTLAQTVAEQVIANTNVVKTQTFRAKNNRYTVFVCLEYNGEVAELAAEIAQQVKQRVSEKSRKRIESDLSKFEEEVKFELFKNKQQ
ncbi:MAG: hypothetical protein IKY64_03125 [Bacteroidaceae bacterium]|nr:hypothetical protein [Bacteroidaceae bacterium]